MQRLMISRSSAVASGGSSREVGSPEALTNRNVITVMMSSTGIICRILRSIYFSIAFSPFSEALEQRASLYYSKA
jgi:hypothetical protein